ncbi:MAG TPA: 5-dehydro-4-deoxy-D-glucuronate isomerase [Opitutaceae bacterium]|jgi:4-deoxy-L-threo-5-hexosulose-uronate ketol-isomerase|nr:5-dehydro-4-deoxy-D-glucuronate isomerase [Opitutaceae bacterium]
MKLHYFPSPAEANTLGTEALREQFLITGLAQPGQVTAHYTDLDRMNVGLAVPTSAALALPDARETGTSFFLERREIGILNIGAPGAVRVGAERFALNSLDCLYIGLGEREVSFENGAAGQAQFYFISTPAHAKHPTRRATRAEAEVEELGEAPLCNRRRICRYIHQKGIPSCQLVMGFTEFEPGSVWNTMPPHTHSRRTEIYLYFDLGNQIVVHLMGQPQATRHLIVRDREVVLSPAWSIHAGAGTGSYRFCWAMGGDNQVFHDMDPVPLADLR